MGEWVDVKRSEMRLGHSRRQESGRTGNEPMERDETRKEAQQRGAMLSHVSQAGSLFF